MPLDAIDESTTLQFVQGSHRWSQWFQPRYFATGTNYLLSGDGHKDRNYLDVPIDEIEAGKWPIIKWAVQVLRVPFQQLFIVPVRQIRSVICRSFICFKSNNNISFKKTSYYF